MVIEGLEITAPRATVAGCDEGKDAHGAVVAVEELPLLASDVDHALGGANGVHVAIAAKPKTCQSYTLFLIVRVYDLPNHKLIVSRRGVVVGIRGGEEVVRDVGADVISLIRPLRSTRQTANLADQPRGQSPA